MQLYALTIALFMGNVLLTALASEVPDIVVVGYNSYDAPRETLIFGSIAENEDRATDGSDRNIQSVGLGSHLWQIDEDGPELKRGWMYRLRLTMQHVKDEYERRGKEDFVVVVADATDVFVTESLDKHTLDHLNDRFLTDFSDHKIVFSTQIYCCNPWELREFGRRDWDTYYDKRGNIPSMYKHLNAGTFMGYASAIIEMAEEMKLWNTTYHRHEGFHSLVGLESSQSIHMIDLEVDDDEWQLAAWFFQDQDKEVPLSTLDFHQDLFAVTGTFRTQETEDEGYVVFPREHFYDMFGEFPATFDKEVDMDQLVVCPYEYDAANMEYTNTITGGHPLVFHFAGNDWLCACKVFATEGFKNVTPKFADNCKERFPIWFDRVQDGILDVAQSETTNELLFLLNVLESPSEEVAQVSRRLGSSLRELDGSPYRKNKKKNKNKRVPRELDSSPYKNKRVPRELDSSPYKKNKKNKRVPRELDSSLYTNKRVPRELDSSPYKNKRVPRELDSSPYKNKRVRRELDSSPYKNKRVPRELDSSPYKNKRVPRELDRSPYKNKRVPRELDRSPYKNKRVPRELDSSPYKNKRVPRELDSSPYKNKRVPCELDS